ncbi:MAG: MBL fold metallo-hydrolase [Deltaproteobacteria bacterium]|nr:MBL fold metallo-hydrolase [Deltaproteobacteria bacterium]
MWINQPGQISEHASMLGNMAFPCYLIKGERSALIDAGITSLAPLLRQEFARDKLILNYVLVTHSHFDHVGGLGVIRELAPRAIVVGSAKATALLSKRKDYDFILSMNRAGEESYQLANLIGQEQIRLQPDDLRVDRVVGQGDVIDLGQGVSLEVHLTPGHTRCSVSYLLKPDRVLFGGDGLGAYLSADQVGSQFTSSYHKYIDSLRKIQKMDLAAIGLPHQGVLTENDADRHIKTAIRCAEEHFAAISQELADGKSVKEITEILFDRHYKGIALMEPEKAFRINLQAMVNVVSKEQSTQG